MSLFWTYYTTRKECCSEGSLREGVVMRDTVDSQVAVGMGKEITPGHNLAASILLALQGI